MRSPLGLYSVQLSVRVPLSIFQSWNWNFESIFKILLLAQCRPINTTSASGERTPQRKRKECTYGRTAVPPAAQVCCVKSMCILKPYRIWGHPRRTSQKSDFLLFHPGTPGAHLKVLFERQRGQDRRHEPCSGHAHVNVAADAPRNTGFQTVVFPGSPGYALCPSTQVPLVQMDSAHTRGNPGK